MTEEIAKPKSILIRQATREDCASIMDLKMELAVHQNLEHLPMLSTKELERDGFDVDPPCFQCLVAEAQYSATDGNITTEDKDKNKDSRVVGYALYFYAYAAWEGKTLHLEDLCVTKGMRGEGIGSKLVKELAKIAVKEGCARIQFEVLESNPARKFYDSLGGWNTTEAEGWHNFRLGIEQIKKLAANY